VVESLAEVARGLNTRRVTVLLEGSIRRHNPYNVQGYCVAEKLRL
jgi:hypothetical protein